MSGICRSRRARSGRVASVTARFKRASAEGASDATVVVTPDASSCLWRMARLVALSSTIRTDFPRRPSLSTTGIRSSEPGASRAVNQNVLPSPRALLTPMVPPITSTRRLEMASPRPVPPLPVDDGARRSRRRTKGEAQRLHAALFQDRSADQRRYLEGAPHGIGPGAVDGLTDGRAWTGGQLDHEAVRTRPQEGLPDQVSITGSRRFREAVRSAVRDA